MHISGEPWRAYIHVCACRRGRPGGFPGNAESAEIAECAESAALFAIFGGKSLGALRRVLERILTTPIPYLGNSIFPTCQFGATSSGNGAYFRRLLAGVRPCLHMSSRAQCGGFGGTRKVRNVPEFSRFLAKSVWGVLTLRRGDFNDSSPLPPLGYITFHISNFVAVESANGTYRWRILSTEHPCLDTSPWSPRMISGERGMYRKRRKLRHPERNPYGGCGASERQF